MLILLLPERRLEGPRELRPGVPVAARVPPQSPEVAALGPARPRLRWPVPRPVRCPARGRERSQLSPGSAAGRCDPGVLLDAGGARTQCTTSGGPFPGAWGSHRGHCWVGSYMSRWKVQSCRQRRETACLVGLEGAAWGRPPSLCTAPGDPGEGPSVSPLDPLSGPHVTRAPRYSSGPVFSSTSCPVL